MFCAPELIFGCTEGVGSSFHVLRSRTLFRRYQGRRVSFSCFASPASFQRYRGRRVLFSCFAGPDSFSAVPRASGPFLMFCADGLVFGGTEGVNSCFHVLPARTDFLWNRGHRVPFTCFKLPNSFSVVPRALGPVLMFYSHRLFFGGTEGVGSRFHTSRVRTRFWRYRGRRVPFSCFARLDSFSEVTRTSGPVLMFCAPGLFFRPYCECRVPFSCFARPDSFSAVPRATSPIFMFCVPGLILGGNEGVGSRFHVLHSRTRFRRY
jgi:hypothetical protein